MRRQQKLRWVTITQGYSFIKLFFACSMENLKKAHTHTVPCQHKTIAVEADAHEFLIYRMEYAVKFK